MGTFLPDVAISVPDKLAAAEYYEQVHGIERGRTGEHWIEMIAGPFRFYLTQDEPSTTAMFAFATTDIEATVASIIEAGGELLSRKGSEVYVRDRYGVPMCIEAQ